MNEKFSVVMGLGNFGYKYVETRHNIGFAVLDYLKFFFDLEKVKKKTIFVWKKLL